MVSCCHIMQLQSRSSAAICCNEDAVVRFLKIFSTSLPFLNSVLLAMRAEFRSGFLKSAGESDLTDTLLARLEELGFIFCIKGQQIKLLRVAIATYKSIYGDLNVPKVCQCRMF